jgi:hypothetical protein
MRHELALLNLSESEASKGGHTHVAIEQASGPEQQFTGEGTMTTAYDQYELYGLGRARGRGEAVKGVAGAGAMMLAAAVATIPVLFFYGVARDARPKQRLVKFSGYSMAALGTLGILGGLALSTAPVLDIGSQPPKS